MKQHRMSRSVTASICAAALTMSGLLAAAMPAAAAAAPPRLGFEDGIDGFTAPTWLSANQTSSGGADVSRDCATASAGKCSLALPVKMIGGSYDQAGADAILDGGAQVDLAGYETVAVDVYAPVANLSAAIYFNGPWTPANALTPLNQGWNTVTEKLAGGYAAPITQASEVLLLVVGQGATYTGAIHFDDVRFGKSAAPTVHITAPLGDATISTPNAGTAYQVTAAAEAGGNGPVAAVTATIDGAAPSPMTLDAVSGQWKVSWNIWHAGDGLHSITVTARDTTGASSMSSSTVYVHDSRLTVTVTTPTFDAILTGNVFVRGVVHADPRFALQTAWLQLSGRSSTPLTLGAPARDGSRQFTTMINTQQLPDGVYTLAVNARDEHFTVTGKVDLQVRNRSVPDAIVTSKNGQFTQSGQAFRFVGWNEYELFSRQDTTVAHLQSTIEGQIMQPGTVLGWRQQIDREMLESERQGLTVLRTWAFDLNTGDAYAFDPGASGNYNEQTFQRLDYIMASAARHHMKVILTLSNYWNDYGGIQAYATKAGLTNKLQFFGSYTANVLFQNYVTHLVDRVNTVTGVAYKKDPTVFAWEMMNEPRDDCADDPTAVADPASLYGVKNEQYCDPSGETLKWWIGRTAGFIKGLDAAHMVTAGGEGHGLIHTAAGPVQWGRADEGGGNDPFMVQNVPGIDFVNFHPYPNASWAQYTYAQTKALITGVVKAGVATGTPVVMEEYGVDRAQPITNPAGTVIVTTDPTYEQQRARWYDAMLASCYRAGCGGTNIWMIADWSDANLNVNLYLPLADALRDRPVVQILHAWSTKIGGEVPWR